ncbi:MAG: beta-ketoacyl synthase [Desulfobacter sp.]|nr:beta-ketoacyl synthase [Desulfobacter sp.]
MRPMTFKHPNIAVVSLANIFPGADTPKRFITNVLEKKEAIIKVPGHRWAAPPNVMVAQNGQDCPEGLAASDRAGLITDFQFDPRGFQIDQDLLAELDPVHHLVLSAGHKAMELCHITPELKKSCGVILAAIALPTQGSSKIARKIFCTPTPQSLSPVHAMAASMVSAPAAILASALGCMGGSFTLDAACASSLFAIKLACEQLIRHKADVMVAGGVSRPDSLYTQVGFSQLKALSPTGRCAPFDKNANGLMVGEGAGIVVLKRLEDAITCGDTIHGVIKGWGVSNDIEGNLVAPASEGQIRAMAGAYKMADWSPEQIQYMECHGSGTVKGDQVEASSIKTILDHFQCPDAALAIGSVKSMIGHLLTAAGAAGFIKTLMAMNQGVLPPSLHFNALPDNSPMNGSNIRVLSDPEPWEVKTKTRPRRAGISAFGFGGINAHILVEQFNTASPVYQVPEPPEPGVQKEVDCAIIGMDILSGAAKNLKDLEKLIFGQIKPEPESGHHRWRRSAHLAKEIQQRQTLFLKSLALDLKEFHIPPKMLSDILPQHLVMLKAAKGALADAGIRPRPSSSDPLRLRMGCAMGIDFDFQATDFYLRWLLHDLPSHVKDHISPKLNFDRTLGALGGIVASRTAREFKFGGPCFTLSAGSASGIKAIETGIQSLGSLETDIFLCGAVDLAGEIRRFTQNLALSEQDPLVLPSEGAAALVLKRLDQAVKDQDKIYGVVTGAGSAGGAPFEGEKGRQMSNQKQTCYGLSLQKALDSSGQKFKDLSLICLANSQDHIDGKTERHAIDTFVSNGSNPAAPVETTPRPDLFCPAQIFGNTHGASGLFSVIATTLCLFHDRSAKGVAQNSKKKKAVDLAAVGSLTPDGASAHLILAPSPVPCKKSESDKNGEDTKKDHPPFQIQLPVTRPLISEEFIRSLGIQPPPMAAGPNKTRLAEQHFNLLSATQDSAARAHELFLEFSSQNMDEMGRQITAMAGAEPGSKPETTPAPMVTPLAIKKPLSPPPPSPPKKRPVFLDRDQCMEYAVGKAGRVLGPAFDIIDTYPVRVRLPNEPLMLVDRIMEIQGEMLSLGSGKIVTQHDVLENAWYLDGGRAPVSISIEAGQADLFLCAWLGIDHQVKGKRKYRLLDAKVTFHRTLPCPGETIEYHIEIDRFLKQGEIYLFFFHYKGYIDGHLFISMQDGCAGFFTETEVENSGGIILKKQDLETIRPEKTIPPLVKMTKESYSEAQIEALRKGDLETAFGKQFKGIALGQNQWLPGGQMTLIHRVLELDPLGGRFGLGKIVAQADIHPDDWFLTCHFIDDMVMPGTLMYECCAHTLRVFVQRMGWVLSAPGVHYDVLPGNESDLKCRGPVTRKTRNARYEIEIKKLGYGPEPYVIADAHMFSDDLEIVFYKDMGMKLAGTTRQDLMDFWRKK